MGALKGFITAENLMIIAGIIAAIVVVLTSLGITQKLLGH